MASFDSLRDLSADARGTLYTLLAPLQALAVAFGLVTDNQWALWAPVVAAVLGFTVAGANSTSDARKYFYGILTVLSPALVAIGVFTDTQAASISALVTTALGLAVAARKTPTFE